MRKVLWIIFLSLAVPLVSLAGSRRVIPIGNQREFDTLQEKIETAVISGATDLSVVLAPGTYFFTDNHLKLYGKEWSGVSLSITGDNSILTASGIDLRDGDPWSGVWDPGCQFLHPDGGCIETFGKAMRSPGLVRIVDERQKLCRIRMPNRPSRPNGVLKDAYLQLSRWYESRTYKVTQIRDGWVYFIADDLEKVSPMGYNVNYDFLYGQERPRFRLCNTGDRDLVTLDGGHIHLPAGIASTHCCKASTFLSIHNTAIGSLTLSGLEFKGNAEQEGRHLIAVYHCRCQRFSISGCRFSDIKSSLFTAEHTDHIEIEDNLFRDCHKHVLSTASTCREARFLDNSFDHCGCDWGPWACITACGDGYLVSGNRISDFGYVGVFVGTPERLLYEAEPGGIVEENELWQNPDFADSCSEYTMMDSGAIYINTCNDRATVRKNYIHDISGVKDNRGIFCDDGARNFDIYENVILRIANSYAIDARRVPEEESSRFRNNVGNCVRDNLTDSPIRFEGNEKNDRCILGANTLIPGTKGGKVPAVSTRNISRQAAQSTTGTIQGTKWEAIVR